MRIFERLYIISSSAPELMTSYVSTKSGVIMKIEKLIFTFEHRFGKCITTDEFNQLFLIFMQEETKLEKLPVYERTEKYRFVFRQGQSGCRDTFIETSNSSFPRRRHLLHESMCGKVNEGIKCFLYDLLDLFVACGKFAIQDGHYLFPEVETEIRIITVEPRAIAQESGWTEPGEIASPPVNIGNTFAIVYMDRLIDSENRW